jgi:hypothetical protein
MRRLQQYHPSSLKGLPFPFKFYQSSVSRCSESYRKVWIYTAAEKSHNSLSSFINDRDAPKNATKPSDFKTLHASENMIKCIIS